jgi:hypothetical protein
LAIILIAGVASADRFNGFAVSNATIQIDDILSGGPPRDGIPAIDHPRFIAPSDAGFMLNDDEVVSVTVGEETRAYPLRILVWHEIVNDEIGGQPIAVTYCPLCGTAMVFGRTVGERTLDFGVSGLLYQSDVLMYDRQTESLWSQLAMSAVSGPLVKSKLTWMPSSQMTWAAWKSMHPQGRVLSTETGHRRNYAGQSYARYIKSPDTLFPVPSTRTELPKKDWVVGVLIDGVASAYPVRSLAVDESIRDEVNGIALKISYDSVNQQVEVVEHESVNDHRSTTSSISWPCVSTGRICGSCAA